MSPQNESKSAPTAAAVATLDILLMCLTVISVDADGDGRLTASELRSCLYDPGALSIVCILTRIGLVVGGERYWLLGHSLIYLFFGCALGARVANTRFPLKQARKIQEDEAIIRRLLYSHAETRSVRELEEAGAPPGAADGRLTSSWLRIFKTYEALFVWLTLIFTAEILVVALYKPDGVPYLPVTIWMQEHPQWSYAVACALLVFVFVAGTCARNAFMAALDEELALTKHKIPVDPDRARGGATTLEDVPEQGSEGNLVLDEVLARGGTAGGQASDSPDIALDISVRPEPTERVTLKDLVSAAWQLRETAHGRALAHKTVVVFSLATLVFLLGGSLMMYSITKSEIIPLVATCVPLLVAIFSWTFSSWRANDYSLLVARPTRLAGHWSVGETSRVVGVCLSVLLCWGIGIGISYWSEPNWIGVTVSYLLSMLMCSTVIVVSYLNTFELRKNIAGAALFAVSIHIAYHSYMYWGQSDVRNGVKIGHSLLLLGSFCVVPVLVILHIGLSVWRDEEYQYPLPKATSVAGALAAVITVACIITLYMFFDRVSAVCLTVFAVFMALAVGAFGSYRTHGNHLSVRAASVLQVVFVVFLVGAGMWAAFVQDPPMKFAGFTISWLSLTLGLLLYALAQLNQGNRRAGTTSTLSQILGSHTTFTENVFPAFTYDISYSGSQRLRSSDAPMCLASALIMVFVWGLLVSILLRPPWVGGLIYCTSGLLLMVSLLHWGTQECAKSKEVRAARKLAPADVAASKSTAAKLEIFHLQSDEELVQGQQAEPAPVVDDARIPLSLTLQELDECYWRFSGGVLEQNQSGDVETHMTPSDLFRLARQVDEQYVEAARFHAHAAILMDRKVLEHTEMQLSKLRAFLHHLDPAVKGSDALNHLPALLTNADDRTWALLSRKMAWWDNHLKELAAEDERRRHEEEEAARQRRQKEEEERQKRKREEEERWRQEREQEEQERLRREREEEERLKQERDEKRKEEELVKLRQKRAEEARRREEEVARQRRQREEEARQRKEERKRQEEEEERRRAEEDRQKARGATVQEAINKLKAIEAQCAASGCKFKDEEFPPQNSWYRCDTLGRDIALFKNGAASEEVCQGGLGDCWMISALSILALESERIERLVVNTGNATHNVPANPHGVYCVRICKNGFWQNVFIDDFLPTHREGSLRYARCRDRQELWVPLIEKAFAKAHGSFEAIEGGFVHEALQDLTGPKAAGYTIRLKTGRSADELWEAAKEAYENGYMLGLGSNSGKDTDFSDQGIVLGHAFSLLMVKQVDNIRYLFVSTSPPSRYLYQPHDAMNI